MKLFFWIALNWLDERTRNNPSFLKRVLPLIGARWILPSHKVAPVVHLTTRETSTWLKLQAS